MPVLSPLSGPPLRPSAGPGWPGEGDRGAFARVLARVEAAGAGRSAVFLGLMTAAVAFLFDQQTKHLAVNQLSRTRPVEALGPLRFHLTFNEGGAFGTTVPGGRWFFLIVTVVVVVIVVRNLPTVERGGQAVAYGLLLAGALGNAADRVFRGDHRVVDFLQLPGWPIFNIADVAITSGFLLLLLLLWQHDRATAAEQRPQPPPPLGSAPPGQRPSR
ncbi:MAG: signal peptidase II [Actinobacteria bacterium]|nr:signal peptidase II [Actinomycetota bacterium]